MLAMDPRIPDSHEYFEFAVTAADNIRAVNWFVNGKKIATTDGPRYAWPLSRGRFVARAQVLTTDATGTIETEPVVYQVH